MASPPVPFIDRVRLRAPAPADEAVAVRAGINRLREELQAAKAA